METIDEKIKKAKETLGLKIPCSIETLTPVHIGSGVKLANGIDFTTTRDTATIVPQATLMEYLEQNHEEMDKFINNGYKLDTLDIGILGKKYSINGEKVFDISEFERNGFGKPYIPGSSLKGAIRTIILKSRFDSLTSGKQSELLQKVTNNKKEWASEPLVQKIFGEDSNNNLMRVLEIFDAEFNEVSLAKVLILSLSNNEASAYKWKKMGRDATNQDHPKFATSIFVETLPIGEKGFSSISLSNFLFNNPEAKHQLKFSDPSLNSIDSFVKTINNDSIEKLRTEKAFFQKLNSSNKLNELLKNIEVLTNEFNKLQKDEFILRLSWGSGWKGMTGDYLSEEWLKTFRNKYGKGMGKPEVPIFPKTRRIVFEDDLPKYLTGWVKIKLNDKIVHQKNNATIAEEKIDDTDWAAKLSAFAKKPQNKKK